jgi:hypothetical protein
MRKLITAASILLIFISISDLLKAAFDSHPVKYKSTIAVAATPTASRNVLLASTTPPPDPTAQSIPTPTPVSTFTLAPLKSRVVKHQPDQFRKGAISNAELSAIKNAIKTIPWSRNSNPHAAANEDYAAIVKECEKSRVHDLLQDLITEALSNDYQPNNEAANVAYSTELNSDFESGDQSDSSNGKSTGKMTAGQPTSADRRFTSTVSQPDMQANAAAQPPARQPVSAVQSRLKTGHGRHILTVRPRIVDVKMQLIALWHQSLAPQKKPPSGRYSRTPHGGEPKKVGHAQ